AVAGGIQRMQLPALGGNHLSGLEIPQEGQCEYAQQDQAQHQRLALLARHRRREAHHCPSALPVKDLRDFAAAWAAALSAAPCAMREYSEPSSPASSFAMAAVWPRMTCPKD